jgi:hypothetical protein
MFLGLPLPPSSGVHVMSTELHVIFVLGIMCGNEFFLEECCLLGCKHDSQSQL